MLLYIEGVSQDTIYHRMQFNTYPRPKRPSLGSEWIVGPLTEVQPSEAHCWITLKLGIDQIKH